MSAVWGFMVQFADLLSSVLGIAASIVLGVPALKAVRSKKDWESAEALKSGAGHNTQSLAALAAILKRLQDEQLGGSRALRLCNLVGFGLLLTSFAFLAVASVDRAIDRQTVPASDVETSD